MNAAPHEAYGKGLHHATVGVPASFKIRLADEKNARPHDQWNVVFKNFIYVWIANADQIFIAEVVNNGDGTLTATYESSFPGTYSVYIEVVELDKRDEGVPIIGTPFALTIDGEPSLDIEELPVCGTEEEDIGSTFWRPGTWVSSNLASATHGVMRDGWVFQPKTCVYDAFFYEDLMLLAELEDPTWLLVLGGSIQRGVFLTIVDMALAKGQKDNFHSSALAKCWGFADIHIGNLRITYQVRGFVPLAHSRGYLLLVALPRLMAKVIHGINTIPSATFAQAVFTSVSIPTYIAIYLQSQDVSPLNVRSLVFIFRLLDMSTKDEVVLSTYR